MNLKPEMQKTDKTDVNNKNAFNIKINIEKINDKTSNIHKMHILKKKNLTKSSKKNRNQMNIMKKKIRISLHE